MASEAYELLALFMRYLFVLMGTLILWRAYRWMRRDAKAYKKEMKRLPDAGLIGEIVNLNTGKSQPLPREGILGSSAACDVRVKGAGVSGRHALFSFVEGKGLMITPVGHKLVLMENTELRGPAYALHGTQLQLGECFLRVRLFAGLNVPHPSMFQRDDGGYSVMPGTEEEETLSPFGELPVCEENSAEGYIPDPMNPFGDHPWNETDPRDSRNTFEPETVWEGQEAPFTAPEDEALPYESPIPAQRHRRRDRR